MPGSQYGFFVQFPHPGGEPSASGNSIGWNTSPNHHRKFLVSRARYLGTEDTAREGEVAFWGEWEPPSVIIRKWKQSGRLPRALHRPSWIRPTDSGFRHNTDPWVFGDRMIWSNCRQAIAGRPNAMQRLTRGTVVCFGSRISDRFCIDTVMVVASAETWNPASGRDLGAGEAFQFCTAESVLCGSKVPARLTLYRGATIDDPVNNMYSFVPARLMSMPDPRFARPAIELPGHINPKTRTPGCSRSMPPGDLRRIWDAIRDQVLAANLILAVNIDTPPMQHQSV